MSSRIVLLTALGMMASCYSVPAQTILFQDNFDTNTTASWSVNSFNASPINSATFAFDYSTMGIPAAPGGNTTSGLRLIANQNPNTSGGQVTGVFSGISVSPLNQSFTGNYTLRFHAWQNAPGPFPAGGLGSTQMTGGGIGAVTTTPQFPGGTINGVYFAASGEGGTTADYRAYNGTTLQSDTSGVYAAGNTTGSTNNSNAYYSQFGNVTPPASQTALYPQQTGTTAAGTQAFAWHQWEIVKTGNIVTASIDGLLIATIDTTTRPLQGDNIFLGHFDINATTTDAAGRDLLFGVIDNVVVFQPVPEPASLLGFAAIGVGGVTWLRRRWLKKSNFERQGLRIGTMGESTTN